MTARTIIPALLTATIFVASCSIEPPLHLREAIIAKVQVATEVNVDVMWQVDWSTEWEFDWNVSTLGPLGYTTPKSMSMHIFTQGPEGETISHTIHRFMGNSAEMDVFVGTHDFLFHNNDSEALRFSQEDDFAPVMCYTRNISTGLKDSSPVYTPAQKAAGASTKAEIPAEEPVSLMPDGLFSLYDKDQIITNDPKDYIYENGKYILKIQGDLNPSTYIYLVQITLLNNDDRVIGSNGAAIMGMAGGVNLFTRESWTSTVSVPMDIYMDRDQDMLGGKVFTFGNPGCNPYDDASVAAMPEQAHFLVLNVIYINGSNRNIRIDVTDQVRALPLGGVITLEIDVNDFPPDESGGGDSGFSALISDWDEEIGSTTLIN